MQLKGSPDEWYVLQTRYMHEQSVACILRHKGYQEFVPLYQPAHPTNSRIQKHDRLQPLYPGYVFCKFTAEVQGPIVTTPGVVRIVQFNSHPAPVSDAEIDKIRCLVRPEVTLHKCPYITAGQQVRVVAGPLKDLEGILLRVKNSWRVVVSLDVLQRSAAVEIDAEWILPVMPHSDTALQVAPNPYPSASLSLTRSRKRGAGVPEAPAA